MTISPLHFFFASSSLSLSTDYKIELQQYNFVYTGETDTIDDIVSLSFRQDFKRSRRSRNYARHKLCITVGVKVTWHRLKFFR